MYPMASSASNMASTSTQIGIRNNNYQVFLNHRGPVVKHTFAIDLYRRLCERGLRVFLDKSELQEGEEVSSQIERAITTASAHIAIFTPRYAESRRCLDELVLMSKSGKPIIPVFYKVYPSDLRRTGGVYAEALRKHEVKARHDSQTIEEWRKALSEAADIRPGFDLMAYNGDERLLLDKVVERVLKVFGSPLPAWQAHEQLEGADSDNISLLHSKDANGSDIEMGVQQPLGSNNNSQQHVIEMGAQQQLDGNNNNRQPDSQLGVPQPSESNNNNQPESGNVASGGNGGDPGSNSSNGNADSPSSNPDHSNNRGYVLNISTFFAVCHGAILTVVASMGAPVSSAVRKNMLFVSVLVSMAIICAFVIKSYKEFSGKRGEQLLCNFLSDNRSWVTQRVAHCLTFMVLSLCFLLASDGLLKRRGKL